MMFLEFRIFLAHTIRVREAVSLAMFLRGELRASIRWSRSITNRATSPSQSNAVSSHLTPSLSKSAPDMSLTPRLERVFGSPRMISTHWARLGQQSQACRVGWKQGALLLTACSIQPFRAQYTQRLKR